MCYTVKNRLSKSIQEIFPITDVYKYRVPITVTYELEHYV